VPVPDEARDRHQTTEAVGHDADALDHHLIERSAAALNTGLRTEIQVPIRNVHRTVGATLSGQWIQRHGASGLSEDTLTVRFLGSAGQSFGAFLAPGMTFRLSGDANDTVGKGLAGGKMIVVPPEGARFDPQDNVIIGNVALYGATSGELYVNGLAGERFAVRNSGARAVVEGVGDHGCEYMTGGIVVVLGPTGNNFAAGMSGGIAYVFDENELFDTRCNLDMVDLESVWNTDDQKELRTLLQTHWEQTHSPRARMILDRWEELLPLFVKVMPIDYRRSLERMRMEAEADLETVAATEEVYHG
jgi:glutamate synthase domain-containing protein 3